MGPCFRESILISTVEAEAEVEAATEADATEAEVEAN